jgi:AsmA protein
MKRFLKIVGIIIAVLIVVIMALPFLININTFRPTLESELSSVLGRQVKVGSLSLSLLSGGLSADNISIADDPQFSHSPFVQAKSLSVGVELIPLIFSRTLNIRDLTLNEPQISLVKSANGERWNFSSLGTNNAAPAQAPTSSPASGEAPKAANETKAEGKTEPERARPAAPSPTPQHASSAAPNNPNITVAKLDIKDGRVTLSRAGSPEKPRVYDKVNIGVTNFSFASSFPFTMTADLPGGGTLKLDVHAGPINPSDAALTPAEAKVLVSGFNLAESGFIDPAMGISGIADLDGTATSDGNEAKVDGTLKATNLKVSAKGSPAGRPVDVKFGVVDNLVKQIGAIRQCDIAMGKAVAHLTGTFDTHGPVTVVNLKLNGDNMPVDDLEAMLPAVGVILPPKATLQGGDLNVNMASAGPVDKLVTTGNVKLQNTQLANFDLGSRLSAIAALAGKKTGNITTIQNFSSDVHLAPAGTAANNINLNIPAIGVLTGAGTVSPSNELAFKMNAAVAGLNVPFGVTGTTTDPKFTSDVRGMATNLLKNLLDNKNNPNPNQQNPLSGLEGLFKKKQ